MPITPTYLLTAAQCPAIQVPAAILDPALGVPTTAQKLVGTTDLPPALVTKFNLNAAELDAQGRIPGGLYAVATGLALSASGSGLSLGISAGGAALDGQPSVPAAGTTLAMADGGGSNLYNYVWVSQAGAVAKNTSSDPNAPPGPPDLLTPWAFLGRVTTLGGNITAIDLSGRLQLDQGNLGKRRTADYGIPPDAPPSSVRFLHQSAGGSYLWDGAAYLRVWEPLALQQETIASGVSMVVPSGYQAQLFGTLTVRGLLQVRGHMRVRG